MSRSVLAAAVVSTCVSLSVAVGAAHDALTVSPDAYRLEFENDWVKVTRVIYGANSVIAPHHHTELASAYVYLNDGPPVLFKHEGLPYAGVTRPATKAGSFRVYKGLKEVHSVENSTATLSDFLRVEFKTEPLEEASLKGKFFREEPVLAVTVQRAQFENAQVRITRVRVVAGDTLTVTTGDQPALLVALSPTGIIPEDGPGRLIDTGKTAWFGPGHTASVRPVGNAGEVLRFDFKTPPAMAGAVHPAASVHDGCAYDAGIRLPHAHRVGRSKACASPRTTAL
jgi:hypothetical protein